jgi:hypothetical protein
MTDLENVNQGQKPKTIKGPPVKEPKKEEPMVLGQSKKKANATDKAAHTTGTSTVTDGEDG